MEKRSLETDAFRILFPRRWGRSLLATPIVNQRGPFLEQIENKVALGSDREIKPRRYRDRAFRSVDRVT
jgi:hypothetical protein